MINWQAYLDAYPDLQAAYTNTIAPTGESVNSWAQRHYLANGKAEGRTIPGMSQSQLDSAISGGGTTAPASGTTAPASTTGTGSSFTNLLGNGAAVTNTPPPTTNTSTTGTTGTGAGTYTGPTVGSGAGQQLQTMWQQAGGRPDDSEGFNHFVSVVEDQFGVAHGNMGAGLPTDFATRFNPTGPTPHPVGYTAPSTAPTGAAAAATSGSQNYAQGQTGNQTGTFETNGTTNTAQNQTSGTATNQATTGTTTGLTNTTGTQNTTQNVTGGNTATGTTIGTNAGNVTSTGGSVTAPVDTLGFGSLLQGATGAAQANDATRNAFLGDVVNTGGSQFGSQVDQAVRNSLTGPQMTGAGDSARARAAGYAGAQVARTNMGDRLNAAQQLAGPSSLTSLVSAGNPYLGSATAQVGNQASTGTNTGTTSNTGTNFQNLVGTNNTTGSTSSTGSTTGTSAGTQTGFQNLLGTTTEGQSGTASGSSTQNAAGVIPQAQQVSTGGGGCVVCTVGLEMGLFRHPRLLRRVVAYKLQKDWKRFRHAARGYFFLFSPYARWLLRHPTIAKASVSISNAVVYEEARISGIRLPFKLIPSILHWTWHFGCSVVGCFPVPESVTDSTIITLAQKHNVFFQVGGVK